MSAGALFHLHDVHGRAVGERDGVAIAEHFGSLRSELACLRGGVGLSDLDHMARVRVQGEHALDLLERVCPSDLYLRDGQARQSLLLHEDGTVRADLLVVRDDEDFLLLAEGISTAALLAMLRRVQEPSDEAVLLDLSCDHVLIAVNGPFAWELLSAWESPGIAGVRYLTIAHLDRALCIRAGRTGEFGYLLLVPNTGAAEVWTGLLDKGRVLDLALVGQQALERAALESWFFQIYAEGRAGLDPVELQLQWRNTAEHEFVGSEALAGKLAGKLAVGDRRRVTGVCSDSALESGAPVFFGERCIGELIVTAPATPGPGSIGLALLELPFAESGVSVYRVPTPAGLRPVRTVSPPFVDCLSQWIRPQFHCYSQRQALLDKAGLTWLTGPR